MAVIVCLHSKKNLKLIGKQCFWTHFWGCIEANGDNYVGIGGDACKVSWQSGEKARYR